MDNRFFIFVCCTILSLFLKAKDQNTEPNSSETLSVLRYENFSASLPKDVAAVLLPGTGSNNYQTYYAKNSESGAYKKTTADYSQLAVNIYENEYSNNANGLPGPTTKNTTYELFSALNGKSKEHFSQLAFLDSSTLVCIAGTCENAALLLVDISGEKMYITSRLPIPVTHISENKEIIFIDREAKSIFLAVNSGTAIVRDGSLAWKENKGSLPGVWIIKPVKNEEKKWTFSKDHIAVRHFYNEALNGYSKDGIQIQTVHADQNGNLWLGLTDGLIGVLPFAGSDKSGISEYDDLVYLYNFNKDLSWANSVRNDFSNKIYQRLKNKYDPETTDTAKIFDHLLTHPKAYTGAYFEDARYTIYSNLLHEANSRLEGDNTVNNEESYWQYVNIDLDNPLSKNKQKLYDYFNFKVRKSQLLQNGLASGSDGAVYAVTNLGIYKLTYNSNKRAITTVWATPYINSFIKDRNQDVAASGTTPAFNAEHNEVVISDNDFPNTNLLILDAKTGQVKNKFALFERGYGSATSNGIIYSQNTIVVANTFGNPTGKKANPYPAAGIMKFSSTSRGNWNIDYDWNTLQSKTIPNSAMPKIASADNILYIYHQPEENQSWQLSGISTENPKGLTATSFALKPDFSSTVKINSNKHHSSFTIGPQKSIFIGTINGILRIKSD